MATIHRRGARWRVQVRRRGLPPLSKTFGKHEDATRWAQTVGGGIDCDHVGDRTLDEQRVELFAGTADDPDERRSQRALPNVGAEALPFAVPSSVTAIIRHAALKAGA